MKKISLKSIKETLTRKEMRNITGGSGGNWCACYSYVCMRYLGQQARCGGDGGCCSNTGSSGSW